MNVLKINHVDLRHAILSRIWKRKTICHNVDDGTFHFLVADSPWFARKQMLSGPSESTRVYTRITRLWRIRREYAAPCTSAELISNGLAVDFHKLCENRGNGIRNCYRSNWRIAYAIIRNETRKKKTIGTIYSSFNGNCGATLIRRTDDDGRKNRLN